MNIHSVEYFWVEKFASASGGKPPDRPPNMCYIESPLTPFSILYYVSISLLETNIQSNRLQMPSFSQIIQLQGKASWPPLLCYIFIHVSGKLLFPWNRPNPSLDNTLYSGCKQLRNTHSFCPYICWRPPIRVKGYKLPPFNLWVYINGLASGGKHPDPPLLCYIFRIICFDAPWKVKLCISFDIIEMSWTRHCLSLNPYLLNIWIFHVLRNGWFNVLRLWKLFKLKIRRGDFKLLRTIYTPVDAT